MVTLDYSHMMSAAVSGGITDDEWYEATERCRATHAATMARRASGELGFFDLPEDRRLLEQRTTFATKSRDESYSDIVILGIGGSALGPIPLRTALRPPAWNLLDTPARDGWPRLHVLDNVDPVTIRSPGISSSSPIRPRGHFARSLPPAHSPRSTSRLTWEDGTAC